MLNTINNDLYLNSIVSVFIHNYIKEFLYSFSDYDTSDFY